MKKPYGILEDLLVKIDTFIFPANFVVMDIEEDEAIPLIIGRPFLRNVRALIDVHKGKLTIRFNDQFLDFNMDKTMQHPFDYVLESACAVNIFDEYAADV